MNTPLRVVVALSGGVDSSAAGLLLKRFAPQSVKLVGAAHMTNWSSECEIDDQGLPASCDYEADAAAAAARILDVPFHHCNFEAQFDSLVFRPMVETFAAGGSTNPDCYCNRDVKFSLFFDHVLRYFRADLVATGHYARNWSWKLSQYMRCAALGIPVPPHAGDLFKAQGGLFRPRASATNDQSYFLSMVPPTRIQQSIFPVSEWTKPELRKLAAAHKLPAADKPTSTGVCFIGKRKFHDLVSDHAAALGMDESGYSAGQLLWATGHPVEGSIVAQGRPVQGLGQHDGVSRYTVGQKVAVRGKSGRIDKAYVTAKRIVDNQLVLVRNWDDPSLFASTLRIGQVRWWVRPVEGARLLIAARHLQPLVGAKIVNEHDESITVALDEPLRAPTKGQVAVLYCADTLAGEVNPGERCCGYGLVV